MMSRILARLNLDLLLTQLVSSWLPSMLAALFMLALFWAMFRATRPVLSQILLRAGFQPALVGMLASVYRFTLLAFAIVMAAGQVGINVGPALAGLGVVGLTIGFAAKDTLSNIMAGFLIFWDKPFRVGDWVTLGEHYGEVAEITMRTTRVRTANNTWIVIPNETVINQVLVNHSTHGALRLEAPVMIAPQAAIATARQAILDGLKLLEGFVADLPATVVVNRLDANGVELLVQGWIEDVSRETPMRQAMLERIHAALAAAGIEAPYPDVRLSIDRIDDGVWQRAKGVAEAAGGFAAI
ncbi:MAG: mechanosensitive ion channel family protein [Acidobacteria bacterium]|nr:mechanosensitive ion channel family protein [Acidobacteriota bacterium]